MQYNVTCPLCSKTLFISEENIDNIIICPFCHEEVCFAMEDVELERKMQKELEMKKREEQKRKQEEDERILEERNRILKKEARKKTSFKFVIAKFNEVEELVNALYREEGWYVISQSTVFIGETPGIFTNTSTREEGLALIFRKDD